MGGERGVGAGEPSAHTRHINRGGGGFRSIFTPPSSNGCRPRAAREPTGIPPIVTGGGGVPVAAACVLMAAAKRSPADAFVVLTLVMHASRSLVRCVCATVRAAGEYMNVAGGAKLGVHAVGGMVRARTVRRCGGSLVRARVVLEWRRVWGVPSSESAVPRS